MIRVRDVEKSYPTRFGTKVVLDRITFDLSMGDRLGVLGRNGAGKSTLMRLISGAERPTSGKIERRMSVSWPLAFSGAFQLNLTGQDNVRFISRIYQQDFKRNLAFVEDFAELGPYLREPVRTYSSGMRARLAFAISMITEFDCFLIDEVGAVGDARFHERCNFELFNKRADRAMIIISHDVGYLREHCNRFSVLHDARLALHDDFEIAYSQYADLVSFTKTLVSEPTGVLGRALSFDVLHRAAVSDDRFQIHTQRGDWARDRSDWVTAEAEYAAALDLHPYEGSYWSQKGHAARAQGRFPVAEIAYRNACALGQPISQLRPFLADVLAHQATSEEEFAIHGRSDGPLCDQPPASPDALVLAQAFCGVQAIDDSKMLELLRQSPTLDHLAQSIIVDLCNVNRCEESIRAADWGTRPVNDDDVYWIGCFCQLAQPDFKFATSDQIRARFDRVENVVSTVLHSDGFAGWIKTRSSLSDYRRIAIPEISASMA